jgi:hypothetical protein
MWRQAEVEAGSGPTREPDGERNGLRAHIGRA